MDISSKYLVFYLILTFIIFNTACTKKNEIELDVNYLTVTDVLKYCSVECGEDTGLKGESLKIKGHLKTNNRGEFLYYLSTGQLVFILFDIRNSAGITIEVLEDSLSIEQRLTNMTMDMLYINSTINYGYIPSTESGCSNSLYLEIDELDDIKNN
jgi:hypothetical protein